MYIPIVGNYRSILRIVQWNVRSADSLVKWRENRVNVRFLELDLSPRVSSLSLFGDSIYVTVLDSSFIRTMVSRYSSPLQQKEIETRLHSGERTSTVT